MKLSHGSHGLTEQYMYRWVTLMQGERWGQWKYSGLMNVHCLLFKNYI